MDHAHLPYSEADVRVLGTMLAAALLLFALYGAVGFLSTHDFVRPSAPAAVETAHASAGTYSATELPALQQGMTVTPASDGSNDHIEGYALQPDQNIEY